MKHQLLAAVTQLYILLWLSSYLLTSYQSKFILQNELSALKSLSQALLLVGYWEPKLRYFVSF